MTLHYMQMLLNAIRTSSDNDMDWTTEFAIIAYLLNNTRTVTIDHFRDNTSVSSWPEVSMKSCAAKASARRQMSNCQVI